jgi:hypothetical protein
MNKRTIKTPPAILLCGFFLLAIIAGSSCKTIGKKNSPASVSEQFFKLLSEQEYEKAKKLGTEKTKKILGVVQTLSEMGGGLNILKDNKKELINCEITGEEAVCNYKTFTGPDQKVYLQKVKGRWLVDMRKDASVIGTDK